MIPKQAIEKAIEGGWLLKQFEHAYTWSFDGRYFELVQEPVSAPTVRLCVSDIALDPTFWQALGKAVPRVGVDDQWKTTTCTCGGMDFHVFGHDAHHLDCARPNAPRGCLFHAKKFIDLVLTGGNTKKFWEEVLS